MIEAKIQGLKELDNILATMTRQVQGRALRQSANAGAQVIKKEARSLVPVDTGLLRRNIIVARSRRNSRPGKETYNITIREGKKAKRGPNGRSAFYGYFIERGTSKKSARPFLRPALQSKQREALDAFKLKMMETLRKYGAR